MVEDQALIFIVFTFTGILLGILFDFFRVFRRTFNTIDFITYLEDILYWILAGIIVLYNIWFFNNGEIRFFMIIGIIMGAIIYSLLFSSILIKIETMLLTKLKNIIMFFYKIIIIPIEKIINFFAFYTRKINIIAKKQNNKLSKISILKKIKNKKGNFRKNVE